jgi:metallo-beta-lactamase family protein
MKLTFFGGAGDVTGANYMLESGGQKIMIDCGLHQGTHYAEKRNWEPFPYDAKEISAVFVTHAHLDHTGLLPKLERDGFPGKIYSTDATKDFAEYILLDSEHILGKEAEREAKPPLYTEADIARLMERWHGIPYHQPVTVGPFTVTAFNAGHILGSASYQVEAEGKRIIFSGDLGNTPAPIIQPTEYFTRADYCLVESAYGDRVHENEDQRRENLEDAIEDTVRRGGTLLIPRPLRGRPRPARAGLHRQPARHPSHRGLPQAQRVLQHRDAEHREVRRRHPELPRAPAHAHQGTVERDQ